MTADPNREERIVDSWRKNAAAWTFAVRAGQIDSRRLSTDHAIVDAVMSRSPRSVIDLGCGEGWLARTLAGRGVHVVGVDAVPELVAQAQRGGGGDFRLASYEEIAAGAFGMRADVAVCNFSLLGKESVEGIFRTVPSPLHPRGAFVVQTLHPLTACGDDPYRDGWRDGTWAGFSTDFTDPAPWYFRTLESWAKLFAESGMPLREVREPVHPRSGKSVSVIFIAEPAILAATVFRAFGSDSIEKQVQSSLTLLTRTFDAEHVVRSHSRDVTREGPREHDKSRPRCLVISGP